MGATGGDSVVVATGAGGVGVVLAAGAPVVGGGELLVETDGGVASIVDLDANSGLADVDVVVGHMGHNFSLRLWRGQRGKRMAGQQRPVGG